MKGGVTASNTLLRDELRWHLLTRRKFEHKIAEAFRLFRENEIEPILIKGWAAAQHYPKSNPRSYGDIDLCVASEDFKASQQLVLSEPFIKLGIDLHKEFRNLDSLKWEDALKRSMLVVAEGAEIRILCEEDHLRVLCTHWLNDGGAYKTRLWDIYYAVENRSRDFDWEKCLGCVSAARRSWVVAAIGAAHVYLGLNIEGLPFAAKARQIPVWMQQALEREWASDIRLRPLYLCMNDRKRLLAQVGKRFPPNPIQATIDAEGTIDDSGRAYFQLASFLTRIPASAKRLFDYFLRTG